MTSDTRNSRDDVIEAAGRLFAEHGYEGTSMRDLGRELGLLGSSLYSHVDGKQDLLVAVVERGAALFTASAEAALASHVSPAARLEALIAGHVDVVLDHRAEVRTFLNEARSLDHRHRAAVVAARDAYEQTFRSVLRDGVTCGDFEATLDPKLAATFVLSILNAVERWYSEEGPIDRTQLVDEIARFTRRAMQSPTGSFAG